MLRKPPITHYKPVLLKRPVSISTALKSSEQEREIPCLARVPSFSIFPDFVHRCTMTIPFQNNQQKNCDLKGDHLLTCQGLELASSGETSDSQRLQAATLFSPPTEKGFFFFIIIIILA